MEVRVLVAALLGAVFINNIVLTRMLGICTFRDVSKKLDSAFGMGLAVTFVMTVTSPVTFLIYRHLLVPYNAAFLSTIAFVLIIALASLLLEIVIAKISPKLYDSFGIFLPMVAMNCAVLGVAVLNIGEGFITADSSITVAAVHGFGAGLGFMMVILIMAGIRERLELARIPENLRGLPITLITAGLLALAFLGFSGMKI